MFSKINVENKPVASIQMIQVVGCQWKRGYSWSSCFLSVLVFNLHGLSSFLFILLYLSFSAGLRGVRAPLGRSIHRRLRLTGHRGSGAFLGHRRRWGRPGLLGCVVGDGAGLGSAGGWQGALGRGGGVAGVFDAGGFGGLDFLLLAELGGQAALQGQRARGQTGGPALGPWVPMTAAWARMTRGLVRAPAAGLPVRLRATAELIHCQGSYTFSISKCHTFPDSNFQTSQTIFNKWFIVHYFQHYMRPRTTKPVISSTGIFVAIANNTLYGPKLLIFSFMPKIIRILSKDHVPWRHFVKFVLYIILI